MNSRPLAILCKKMESVRFNIAKGFKSLSISMILIAIMSQTPSAFASMTCQGHFVNPISDICWSCLMPISIGGFDIGKGASPKKRDTKNPANPFCMCTKRCPRTRDFGRILGARKTCRYYKNTFLYD